MEQRTTLFCVSLPHHCLYWDIGQLHIVCTYVEAGACQVWLHNHAGHESMLSKQRHVRFCKSTNCFATT
jgi:hypothetical protein